MEISGITQCGTGMSSRLIYVDNAGPSIKSHQSRDKRGQEIKRSLIYTLNIQPLNYKD